MATSSNENNNGNGFGIIAAIIAFVILGRGVMINDITYDSEYDVSKHEFVRQITDENLIVHILEDGISEIRVEYLCENIDDVNLITLSKSVNEELQNYNGLSNRIIRIVVKGTDGRTKEHTFYIDDNSFVINAADFADEVTQGR